MKPDQWGTGSSPEAAGSGTHVALARGNGDSSWVVHWYDGDDERIWLSKALVDTFPATPQAWWPVTTDATTRVFCAGHSALKDGRLLVVGGTTVQHTGLARGSVFNPKAYGQQPSYGWTATDTLLEGRWYPTATTLGDGKVQAFSGQNYFQMLMFGGVGSSGGKLNDQHPLNLKKYAGWSADAIPVPPLAGREGCSSVLNPKNGRTYVFGGETAGGYSDTLWALVRSTTDDGERWRWEQQVPGGCSPDNVRPGPRSRYTMCNDPSSGTFTQDTVYLFGGVNSGGALAGDTVWRYVSAANCWTPLVASSGSRPGPRYGHTAVWVRERWSGSQPVAGSRRQMLVYGGRKADSTLAGDTLWSFRLGGSPQWTAIPYSGTKPASREGHAAIVDERTDHSYDSGRRRVYVFGGEGNSLLQDTWVLRRAESATDDYQWSWQQLSPNPKPSNRTRHSAIYDPEFERMLVFGGDTNGSGTAGGQANDLWGLGVAGSAEPAEWTSVAQDSVPAARSGHCVAFHISSVLAKVPERYDPATGSWAALAAGRKFQPYYPHTFLLRSGKLFWAGNNDDGTSYNFDPVGLTWGNPSSSGFTGSCSAMFRPDSVLKTGDKEYLAGNNAKVAIVDSSGNATWANTQQMQETRQYHNITLLPTGQVLLTGGLNTHQPRFWDPASGTWSDTLSTDPASRHYHSTALLLPDGRVLSSGGPPSDRGATIFWPPYLFNKDDSGTLATRPVINSVTPCGDHIEYGETFTVAVDTASKIGIVCLMRPGAVTHQLNMDQRFLRLPFQVEGGALSVTGPLSPNHAPPGQYLLFVVKTKSGVTDSIPSVAKWVRLSADDAVAPGQTTNMAEYVTGLTFIDVMWTAPGDDAACGQAVKYDVRYSLNPITSSNFNQAGTVSKGAPQAAGAEEIAHRAGLLPCTTYYFALKTQDEAGNWSSMSNVVAATTECLGEGLMASGSGPNGWTVENTLLAEAQGTEPQTDVYRLKGELVTSDGKYLLKLSQPDPLKTMLEGVELAAVEHDPKLEAFSVGGKIVLGSRAPASAATSQGHDLRSLVDGTNSTGWVGHPGDTLEAVIPGLTADSSLLVIESGRRGGTPGDSLGIEIRALDATQGLLTRHHYRPRARFAEHLLESEASERVQLVLHGEYTVRYVGLVSLAAEAPKLEPLMLASAKLEGQDVADLAAPGGSSLLLVSGGEVELAFMPPEGEAKGRDLFLNVRGSWTDLPATPSVRSRVEEASLPRVFALYPPRPNPARGVVRIGFDVPYTSPVSIEIFDLQGRRVRTLTGGERPPGSYSLEWDGRDERGSRLGPSVYLYRMEAEGFHARGKLVALP